MTAPPMILLRWTPAVKITKTVWHATRLKQDIRTVYGSKLKALCGGNLRTGWLWDAVPAEQTVCAACLALANKAQSG